MIVARDCVGTSDIRSGLNLRMVDRMYRIPQWDEGPMPMLRSDFCRDGVRHSPSQ